MIKYGVITDEISQDINEAAFLANKYGLDGVEIRSVNGRAPQELTADDIREIKTAMKKYNLECLCISAPFYKCNLTEEDIEKNLDILGKCIKLAKKLGTNKIRGFTFFKQKDLSEVIDDIADAYNKVIPILEKEDMYLLLESDPSLYASCGKSLSFVLKKINNPRIKGLWDPGNDIYSPEKEIPYPDGYNYMKGKIAHVHIKDAVRDENGEIKGVSFGNGDVDFEGQLKALKDDGYTGAIVMETHYRVKSKIPEELLTRPGGSAFSLGGYDATEECLINFKKMINKIGLG